MKLVLIIKGMKKLHESLLSCGYCQPFDDEVILPDITLSQRVMTKAVVIFFKNSKGCAGNREFSWRKLK